MNQPRHLWSRRTLLHGALATILAGMLAALPLAGQAQDATPRAAGDVILATTTSTADTGLLDSLAPIFKEETGYTLKPIAVGSGAALELGEKGEADVLLVHSPAAEGAFMDAGFGTERRTVMYNDFVIVGPASDPAGIAAASGARAAMQRIADLDLQLVAKDQELKMELASRDSQLAQAKRILASVGKTLPKPAKLTPSKNAFPQQAIARATVDLTRVSEKLASALQEELKRGTVVLEQRGDKLTLALASGELFGKGRVTMTAAGAALVKRIGVALRKFRPESVEVAGHTDNIPVKYDPKRPFKDNADLSRARAENASRALIKGGLGADRVRAVGYADSRPVATNDTEEGRTKNRRVEIIVSQSAQPIASSEEKDGQVPGSRAAASYGAVVQKVATR